MLYLAAVEDQFQLACQVITLGLQITNKISSFFHLCVPVWWSYTGETVTCEMAENNPSVNTSDTRLCRHLWTVLSLSKFTVHVSVFLVCMYLHCDHGHWNAALMSVFLIRFILCCLQVKILVRNDKQLVSLWAVRLNPGLKSVQWTCQQKISFVLIYLEPKRTYLKLQYRIGTTVSCSLSATYTHLS